MSARELAARIVDKGLVPQPLRGLGETVHGGFGVIPVERVAELHLDAAVVRPGDRGVDAARVEMIEEGLDIEHIAVGCVHTRTNVDRSYALPPRRDLPRCRRPRLGITLLAFRQSPEIVDFCKHFRGRRYSRFFPSNRDSPAFRGFSMAVRRYKDEANQSCRVGIPGAEQTGNSNGLIGN